MTTNRQPPVFIVGCPRSGTTLLAGLLGAHSRLVCGPETEFFTGLHLRYHHKHLCQTATWPEEAASYLFSIIHEKPIPDYYDISRDEIITFLKRRERSLPAILESLTQTYMDRSGKKRWVEKTPTHLAFTREIRSCYPDAPIIRILRDPRDTALSLLNVPWGPPSFAAAVLLWQHFDEASASFFESDHNCMTIRLEDLLGDPGGQLCKVCDFIGEEFEPDMLDTSRSIGHLNPTKISWKQKAGQQLDSSRVAVWRRETTTEQQAQAEAIVGDRLKAYRYPTSFEFDRYIQVLNLGTLARFPELISHFLDGNTRFWKVHARETPCMRFFLGDPHTEAWIGRYRFTRLTKVWRTGLSTAHSFVNGIPLIWLAPPSAAEVQRWGLLCHVFARFLPRRLEVDAFCKASCTRIT
jgi:hypothetical protein